MEDWLIAVICVLSAVLLVVLLVLLRNYFRGAQFREKVDSTGKVAVVTGANTGIGLETVRHLNLAGAKVYLLCRNEQRAQEAIDTLVKEGCDRSRLVFERCDLSNFSSVRECASNILKQEKTIDILVNNAGIMLVPKYETTVDGHELTWQSNHLGPFLLTELLLPAIVRSKDGRIVNVSALLHRYVGAGPLNLNTIDSKEAYGSLMSYCRSKLANVMYARELSARLRSRGTSSVLVNSLHPGVVDTTLASTNIFKRTPLKQILRPLSWFTMKTVKDGAQTQIFLALSTKLNGESGKYYSDCKLAPVSDCVLDDAACQQLYEYSMEQVGLSKLITIN